MMIFGVFRADQRGSFNTFFAVALLPLLLAIGSAVDYSQSTGMQVRLQAAADAAALAMAKQAAAMTNAEVEAKGSAYFEAALNEASVNRMPKDFVRTSLKVAKLEKVVRVDVAGEYPTSFMAIAGFKSIPLAAIGQAAWGVRKIEVALVLDNTGSMAGSKLSELQKAAKNLVTTLESAAKEPDQVKIALVPFATQVRVDTSNKLAPWLDFATYGIKKSNWAGCIADRDQPYDTNDAGGAAYPAVACASTTLAQIRGLTSDFAGLRTAIDGMKAGGNTNTTIGLAWGLSALSPADPLAGGLAFGSEGVDKFMIMLTDGDNTQNRWTTSQYQIDLRTTAACNEVKKTTNRITLYTIRVINGNAALLKACATDPSRYFDVTSASQLDAVFKSIADEITSIRLTM